MLTKRDIDFLIDLVSNKSCGSGDVLTRLEELRKHISGGAFITLGSEGVGIYDPNLIKWLTTNYGHEYYALQQQFEIFFKPRKQGGRGHQYGDDEKAQAFAWYLEGATMRGRK